MSGLFFVRESVKWILSDSDVLKREHFQILHQGTQQWVRSSILSLLSIAFWVKEIIHAKSGERGVWNPAMGGTFIVLDANCIGIRARRALEGALVWCHAEVRMTCVADASKYKNKFRW